MHGPFPMAMLNNQRVIEQQYYSNITNTMVNRVISNELIIDYYWLKMTKNAVRINKHCSLWWIETLSKAMS